MPRPHPPEHSRFKKGQSGNPGGKRKLPTDLKKIAPITADELTRTIAKYLRMTTNDLQDAITNPGTPALDLIIASTSMVAIRNGDISKAEYLFLRSLGRVKEEMKVSQPEPVVIKRSNGEEVTLGVKSEDED